MRVGELKIDGDFLYFLADAAVTAFQYGNPDKLCIPLIEAKKAGEDVVKAYATYVNEYYGDSVATYNQQNLKNTALTGNSGDRLWWFQVCTEVAYFQVAPSNDSIRSSRIDTRYHLDLCKNVFREGIYPDVDATNIYYGGTKIAAPDGVRYGDRMGCEGCGEKNMNSQMVLAFEFELAGSKIIFTNGSQDPWRHASKQKSSPESKS
ncbi:Serine carboxypeptidase S28 family protein [Forsythia ovata]|uniref:Serine carboxypeptidase S28 family protein n=1 Tax=Forsythia ovata TaxID=205694 RepID=A0ABD1P5A6_9LAMI